MRVLGKLVLQLVNADNAIFRATVALGLLLEDMHNWPISWPVPRTAPPTERTAMALRHYQIALQQLFVPLIVKDSANVISLASAGVFSCIETLCGNAHNAMKLTSLETSILTQLEVPSSSPANSESLAPIHRDAHICGVSSGHGSFEAFRRIASKEKWLRVHNTQEWTDYCTSEHLVDLQQFFDFYLKDEDNGWQPNPRVRLAVLDPGSEDTLDRVVADWPVPGLQSKALYLYSNNSLSESSLSNEATLKYNSSLASGVTLDYRVPETMEVTGYSKLRLWVSSPDSTDMDISISVQKLSTNGTAFPSTGSESSSTIGPTDALPVSHRELDIKRSTDLEPFLLHTSERLLSPGEIVPVDIPL
ncbi:hypothetical protein CaCOL14_008396 [Colletotrichum acutatum]